MDNVAAAWTAGGAVVYGANLAEFDNRSSLLARSWWYSCNRWARTSAVPETGSPAPSHALTRSWYGSDCHASKDWDARSGVEEGFFFFFSLPTADARHRQSPRKRHPSKNERIRIFSPKLAQIERYSTELDNSQTCYTMNFHHWRRDVSKKKGGAE